MGILQSAAETYDAHRQLVGVYREGHPPLSPISHMAVGAGLEISLDQDGSFLSAVALDKEETIIPVTEASAGRSGSNPAPHPLCDQIKYVAAYEKKRHEAYLAGLREWAESPHSHPKLVAILRYVSSGTILSDLAQEGVIRLTAQGLPESKDESLLIRWRVMGEDSGETTACWQDKRLFDAFIAYYAEKRSTDERVLCMVLGQEVVPAKQHAKGIVSINGNAKLISGNDNDGFTYRGRFSKPEQAATVGYVASQKAHNALRWVAEEEKNSRYGKRAILYWNPQGKVLKNPLGPFLNRTKNIVKASDYQAKLYNSLMSFKRENQLTERDKAVVASFDAATTGRLALTYYSELPATDFLQRLHDWDGSCCWEHEVFGAESPPLWDLVNCAFGTQQTIKNKLGMKTDDKLYQQQMQRILACKLSSGRIPVDIVRNLTQRASMPQAYDSYVWLDILFTACAALRKYRKDQYGEEWSMALDTGNTNRSYLFGRLLAIAELVELRTYDEDEVRQTNAMKLQTVFSRRPLHGWRLLEESLVPYYQKLQKQNSGDYDFYKWLVGTILEKLSNEENELDRPLDAVYLMGYYNQRQSLRKKKGNQDAVHADENEMGGNEDGKSES